MLQVKDTVEKYLELSDWRVKENSTVSYSIGGLILSNSGALTANYWLDEVYTKEIGDAHKNASIHIHDLSLLSGYCAGWNLKQLIEEGLGGVEGKITSKPAKHLSSLCNQMVNFLGILQNEWAGAQAFSSFDTYLAPFVKADNLTYKQTKQAIESFIYGVNTPSRWGCVKTDTEILTKEGWKNVNELKKGELIYSYDMNKNIILTPLTEIVRKMNVSGIMHKWSTQGYCQTVTPEHRCIVNKFNSNELVIKTSEKLTENKTIQSMPLTVKGIDTEGINLSDDEIKLASIIYTDGGLDFRKNKIHKVKIFKSKNRKKGYNEIINVLNNLNIKYSQIEKTGAFNSCVTHFVIYGEDARRIEKLVGQKNKIEERFYNMNERQAMLFLKEWSIFDGNYEKFKLQCDNDDIVNSIQRIAINAGRTTHVLIADKGNKKPTTYVKVNKAKSCTPKLKIETYDGEVWCPNVAKTGTAIFRDSDKNVFISGNCQAPFTNITLDWTVPADLADLPAIVGGKECDFTYGDCKKEMGMINKAFLEVMLQGDAEGRGFQYPIPTYSITQEFDWAETENNKLLFEMTRKYGTPYFSNYINSDMSPDDTRSMCPLTEDTLVLTKSSKGIYSRQIKELYHCQKTNGSKYQVFDGGKWCDAIVTKQVKQKVYEITLSNGSVVKMGEYHLQPVKDKGDILAKEIKENDWIPFNKQSIVDNRDGRLGKNPNYCLSLPKRKNYSVFFDEDDNYNYYRVESIKEINYEKDLYCFEVDNENHLFMLSNGMITHNCRLRLDLRELRKKSGGFFGSGESTGSVGVVTINMPQIGYLAKNKEDFYKRLEKLMDISAASLDIKRKFITKQLEGGLYPYTKRYLGNFDNHFSTIGLVGLWEAYLNLKSETKIRYKDFAENVLNFMRNKLSDYQEKYDALFNLEATPAESTAYRLALHDLNNYEQIITSGTKGDPYYTNSSNLPVDFSNDIFDSIEVQDVLQPLYTGGTVFHAFHGEKLSDWKDAMTLVKSLCHKTKIPYYTISPIYSICSEHGYLEGEVWECPKCGKETEVYSRITGYYRPVKNWNIGKTQEFKERKTYDLESTVKEL